MRLKNITATPHPFGNMIILKWINPAPDQYPGVRIMRRESTHPTAIKDGVFTEAPQDGELVLEKNAFLFGFEIDQISQNDLNNEEIPAALRQRFFSNEVILSSYATISCEVPGVKWRMTDKDKKYLVKKDNNILNVYLEGPVLVEDKDLKGEIIYYYTLFPYKGDPPEYYFDSHNRVSAMASSPYNIAGQMYGLLPSIYHRYDSKRPPKRFHELMSEGDWEKGQLRRLLDIPGSLLDQLYSFARAMHDLHNLNKLEGGLLPLLAQWIGWQIDHRLEIEDQRNEIRNAPYIYRTVGIIPTVGATVKRIIGWESRTKEFVHNVFLSNTPERLNLWARRRSETMQWFGPGEPISPEPLSLDFAYEGRPTVAREGDGTLWLFYHTHKKRYDISKKKRKDTCNIWYKTYREEQGWSPSQPLTNRMTFDRHPTAAVQAETLWVFWDTYHEADRAWRINYSTRTGGQWSAIENFGSKCRMPWAAADGDGGLWLFWLEKGEGDTKWQLKYNRHNGARWELEPAASFPLDGGKDPRIESDLFVLTHPDQSIWVFWARKGSSGGHWEIVYRVKQGTDPEISDWSEIHLLPKPEENHNGRKPDDREPAALLNGNNDIELFWSSKQNGSWSVWQGLLKDLEDIGANGRESANQVTDNPYSQRNPLPLSIDTGTLLIYRSNESLHYTSEVYKATKTIDFRYAGCTTVDTENITKNKLRGKLQDFQTYTYDAGKNGKRTNENWYGWDTLGVYLTPDTEEEEQIIQKQALIEKVLKKFMPIQVRAVFIINPPV